MKRENFKSDYPILVSNPATINSMGWHASTNKAELAKLMITHQETKQSKAMYRVR